MARQMKDSGIEWIGEIPETWDTIKFKYLFSIIGGNGFPESLQGQTAGTYPFCKVSDINSHSDYVDAAANYVSDEVVAAHGFNIIPCGSIIIAKIGAALQKNHRKINSVPCCIDNNTQALVPVRADSIRYLLYLTRCIDMGWFDNNSTVPSLNNNKLLNFFVPNVNVAEQHRISAFLDRKCAEIDAVIERTKATIEEYKKLKQAVITEAVTKGVRGPRPMKDSGIEWVSDIADTWVMSRIGLHYSIVLGKMLCDKQLTEEYTLEPYFCAANIHFDGVSQEQLKQMWFSPAEKISYRVQDGDLLVVEGGAGAGGAAIVEVLEQPTYVQNSVMIVRGLSGQTNRYLRYWIECLVKKGYVDVVCNKATIPHFTKDKLATMPVPVIPVDEMEEIADYLDEKCAALDTLIAKKTALLTELETYKKSLIHEYVTGKKEVL